MRDAAHDTADVRIQRVGRGIVDMTKPAGFSYTQASLAHTGLPRTTMYSPQFHQLMRCEEDLPCLYTASLGCVQPREVSINKRKHPLTGPRNFESVTPRASRVHSRTKRRKLANADQNCVQGDLVASLLLMHYRVSVLDLMRGGSLARNCSSADVPGSHCNMPGSYFDEEFNKMRLTEDTDGRIDPLVLGSLL